MPSATERAETIGGAKTLHNRVMDMLYRSIRSRMGMEPVPMSVILRHVVRDRQQGIRMGDRSHRRPALRGSIGDYRVRLSRSTDFVYDGLENMALRWHAGLFRTHRQDTAGITIRPVFELIYDGQERVAPHEMKRYAAKPKR